ncbi:MAG: hypothetical protein AB1634_09925 [Thermodesulfobacteriota bacterium]
MAAPRRAGTGRCAGFSLFELILVLVLAGFMGLVATPALSRFLEGLAFRQALTRVVSCLQYGRLMAVTEGRPVHMALADDQASLVFWGGVEATRPLDLDADESLTLEPEEAIFWPEGQASPQRLTFRRGERVATIELDPLTALPLVD